MDTGQMRNDLQHFVQPCWTLGTLRTGAQIWTKHPIINQNSGGLIQEEHRRSWTVHHFMQEAQLHYPVRRYGLGMQSWEDTIPLTDHIQVSYVAVSSCGLLAGPYQEVISHKWAESAESRWGSRLRLPVFLSTWDYLLILFYFFYFFYIASDIKMYDVVLLSWTLVTFYSSLLYN